jgi:hypothetical protein
MSARLEGVWVWLVVAVGAAAGVVVFGMRRDWLALVLFAVATLLAAVQLGRIFLRTRGGDGRGGTGRRY